jgi:hypothetical protein
VKLEIIKPGKAPDHRRRRFIRTGVGNRSLTAMSKISHAYVAAMPELNVGSAGSGVVPGIKKAHNFFVVSIFTS